MASTESGLSDFLGHRMWSNFGSEVRARIQVRSATLLHSSSHAHLFEYDGWLLKA